MFGMGDEMFGKWETKCSAFRRTKVRRKSPAAYQEAQIKIKIFLGHSFRMTQFNKIDTHMYLTDRLQTGVVYLEGPERRLHTGVVHLEEPEH